MSLPPLQVLLDDEGVELEPVGRTEHETDLVQPSERGKPLGSASRYEGGGVDIA